MEPDKNVESQIQECLTNLCISSLVQWDVLFFVFRHKTTLASAEEVAQLLGYASTTVRDALDHLVNLKLIGRSRASRGVRLYQFLSSAPDRPSNGFFRQLITLTENPGGRFLLVKKLGQPRTGLYLAKKKDQNG